MLKGPTFRRIATWVLAASFAAVLAAVIASLFLLQPSRLKVRLTSALTARLGLEADIDDLSVSFLPRPQVHGERLVLRVRERPDLPPFITIDHFSVAIGLFSAIRKHVGVVHVDGLKIVVPPPRTRDDLARMRSDTSSKVIVDHLIAHDALLTFAQTDPKHPPLSFIIRSLQMEEVGFGRRLPFSVVLINPIPTGLVEATGTFGPWRTDDAASTALAGRYTFSKAELATINGIGGTLTSAGDFQGTLAAVSVRGTADIPDFSLDLGGKAQHLFTDFDVVVDGTSGTVALKGVDAKMAKTAIHASGAITNLPGPGRHDVQLDVRIAAGRAEDLLALTIDSPRPVLTGGLMFETHLSLPPGSARVRNRLRMTGRFALSNARFTDPGVQQKIQELSQRSQGKSKNEPGRAALTTLRSRFALSAGKVTMTELAFDVPGATVALDGTYDLASAQLDLRGFLTIETTISKTMGGFKSFLMRPLDTLFRQEGGGSLVPIRISGPRQAPKFGIDFRKMLK